MGANDEFVLAFLDDEVVHGDTRQVGVEGGPRGSAVQTRIASAVGAHEEAIFPVRGLNEGVHRLGRQADGFRSIAQALPRAAVVFGDEDVRVKMIQAVGIEPHVQPVGVVRTPEYFAHPERPFVFRVLRHG